MADLISRQAAIDAVYEAFCYAYCDNCEKNLDEDLCGDCHRKYQNWSASKKTIEKVINALPSAQPEVIACGEGELSAQPEPQCNECPERQEARQTIAKYLSKEPQWIPIKTRPMTDEERDYWSDHFGYDVGYENDTMFDCKMPEDKQPVWIQSRCGYVYEDVCETEDGMLGLEGNGDWSDIVAWMPKYVPEPWKGEKDADTNA